MNPLLILLIGMAIVVGGVLWLRLHAFVALISAALVVALLTPRAAVENDAIRSAGVRVIESGKDGVQLKLARKQKVIEGRVLVMRVDSEGGPFRQVASGQLEVVEHEGSLYLVTVQLAEAGTDIRAGDRILHHTQFAAAESAAKKNLGERTAQGFGNTCLGIGIVIAMAAIIGKCLMDSGAAQRIVLSLQRVLGERRTPLAFAGSGFILGMPVFFDTVFYLLIPLGKAMRLRTGRNYLLYVLTIVCGATMAHSLVPPTPGPLFVANELGVDLGAMILGGIVVGLCAASVGFVFAHWANRRWDIPLRESAELSSADLQAMADRNPDTLPPLWLSLLPILLPVLLISGGTVVDMAIDRMGPTTPNWIHLAEPVMKVLGNKNIALSLAAAAALVMLACAEGVTSRELTKSVSAALASGGVIILITAAGGAFGHVLRQTDIAGTIQRMVPATQVGLLPLAFFLCTIVRTAQGSATVAMITTVGIIGPLLAAQSLTYSPLYIACAIGCGSKPISWMNDSGFWVISTMSGLTEAEMLKTNTVMGILMGAAGLLVTMLGAWLVPLG